MENIVSQIMGKSKTYGFILLTTIYFIFLIIQSIVIQAIGLGNKIDEVR